MSKVVIVYHSGYGHTQKLAEAVAAGAREGGAETELISATELQSPDQGPWDRLAAADAIVFGAPTYMGSVSAPFKAFMEASSKVWFTQGWKDKIAAGFTNSGSPSGDKLNSLVQLAVFAAQHSMVWVSTGQLPGFGSSDAKYDEAVNRGGYYLGVGAQSFTDQSAEIAPGANERETGRQFGARIAKAAKRWAA